MRHFSRESKLLNYATLSGGHMMENLTKAIASDWTNQSYYEDAEDWLDIFWDNKSVFYYLFNKCDTTNITELACGHGRHVTKYIDRAKHIYLVDVNQTNIEFCKHRYSSVKNISYICNNGSNFSGIPDNSQTCIFSYDSMVHFELDDVKKYLEDSYRILKHGGRALFHHSNYYSNPGGWYQENPHWRNFMSDRIFSHFALRSEFKILLQVVIPWGNCPNIDCVSLIETR